MAVGNLVGGSAGGTDDGIGDIAVIAVAAMAATGVQSGEPTVSEDG